MMRGRLAGCFLAVLVLGLVAAGCAPAAAPQAPASQPAAQAPAAQPPAAPTDSAPPVVLPATGVGTNVDLASKDNFGKFLVDDKGMTLYLYTKDTPNTSNCYNGCAAAWPPLLTKGAPVAGAGLDASLLGTTTRTDGTTQVTYGGWPLYYYAKDKAAGDVTGQNVGGVWFVLSPKGKAMQGAAPGQAPAQAPAATPAAQQAPAGPAALKLVQNDKLGQFIADDKGMTLYLYTKDTPGTSNCYNGCAAAWPPLLTKGAAVVGDGLDASLLGTTTRTDGTTQVTYGGWPLYYWVKDKAAGDTTGQWVGSVWFVVSPQGQKITAGQPPATPAPAPTAAPAPSGGGYGGGYGG